MLTLTKATERQVAAFPIKASEVTINACAGYPNNCMGSMAIIDL